MLDRLGSHQFDHRPQDDYKPRHLEMYNGIVTSMVSRKSGYKASKPEDAK